MKNRNTFLLIIILLLASFVRLWQLGAVPISPDWDEVALGYNAYSVMLTGKDEYGDTLPLVLQSFGDYKPALYVYFAIPSIAALGLNTFAVRFPSAILGILTVLATYFLVKVLFTSENSGNSVNRRIRESARQKNQNTSSDFLISLKNLKRWRSEFSEYSEWIALLSTFLLAISPWHIQFSRVAFEANIALSLNIFGVLFFLKGLRNHWMLFLAVVFFGLSLYAYQSEKVFVPLFVMALLLIYGKQLIIIPKKVLIGLLITILFVCAPILYLSVTDETYLSRAKGVSLLSAQTAVLQQDESKLLQAKEEGSLLGQILYNRRVTYGREIVSGYLSHYNLNWLFIHGDLDRHHAPGMGLLYLWELPFLLVGIYLLLFSRFPKQTKWLIISWFLISPIPAAITLGTPHAVRTLNFLPTFQIFTAIGLLGFFVWNMKYKIVKRFFCLALFVFIIFNVAYYFNQYFVQQNYFNSKDWQYGYKEAVSEVIKREKEYDKVIVSTSGLLDQSYIFFLFYLKYPPAQYQQERQEHNFSKYEFRAIDWEHEKKNEKVLYVGQQSDFPNSLTPLKQINFLNGDPGIILVK